MSRDSREGIGALCSILRTSLLFWGKSFITNSDETFKKGDLDVSGQIGSLIWSRILHNTTEYYS